MHIKQTSKIQLLLLIVAMLSNPVLVSADALFSDKNTNIMSSMVADSLKGSTAKGSTAKGSTAKGSTAEMHTSCHDEKAVSSKQQADQKAECCDDPCQCGASGCSPATAAVSTNKSQTVQSMYSLNYLRDHYLSFVSSPSSPPPIA